MTSTLALSLLLGGELRAQSLTEMAEHEKQRREALRRSGRAGQAPAKPPARALAERPAAPVWRSFSPPEGDFAVRLPGVPEAAEESLHFDGRLVRRRRYKARAGEVEYSVARGYYPPDVLHAPTGIERVLTALRLELRQDLGAEPSAPAPTGSHGQVGWRLEVGPSCRDVPRVGDRPWSLSCAFSRTVVFVSGAWVYLVAQTQRAAPAEPELPDEAFFESFQIAAPGAARLR